jgi:predicted porin
VSTTLGQEESTSIVSDDIGIGIEYPIQNGRIRLSRFFHKQTEKNLTSSLLINDFNYNDTTISALYNLNKNTSVKVIYTEINSKNSDIYINNLKAAAVEVIYKF